jgi:broad specificity phosphatase PhoE
MRTVVHLVRHAEVENPDNIWYGQLEGFVLSQRGLRQAEALGRHFAGRPLAAVYSSPLTRAIETATPVAAAHSLEVQVDEQIKESVTRLQGKHGDLRIFRNPLNLRFFINPFRPSWGEPYEQIGARMLGAVNRMRETHRGGEVAAVSHMTPIVVARLWVEGSKKPAWRAGFVCGRASVTTFEFNGDTLAATTYLDVGKDVE